MTVERPKVWELIKKLKEKGFGLYLLQKYQLKAEELLLRELEKLL